MDDHPPDRVSPSASPADDSPPPDVSSPPEQSHHTPRDASPADLPSDASVPSQPARPAWLERFSDRRVMLLLAGLSAFFLLTALGLASYILKGQPAPPLTPTLPPFTPPESLSALAGQYPQLTPLLNDSELDSAYKDFVLAYQQGGVEAALDLARKRGLINDQDQIIVTLELDTTETAELVKQLEERGVIVLTVGGNLMDIAIPLSLVDEAMQSEDPASLFTDISGLEHVVRLRLPLRNTSESLLLPAEEALPIIGADVWHSAGFTGRGVKIGILDLGFNGYKNLLGKELPANVVVQSFIAGHQADDSDTEHGAAVAEVIYDIAPEAQLYFAAYWTLAEQRQAVEWLLSQGVQIISHSAGSAYGPMDGSSTQARLVDSVVQQGILWVNSAGNNAQAHYRGVFTDTDGDGYHEFAPGDEMMGMRPDYYATLTLNWDDWATGSEDYDLFVLDKSLDKVTSSENIQDGGEDAAEWLRYNFGDTNVYYVAIRATSITRPGLLDLYVHNAEIEYFNADHSLNTPGDSFLSFTVGATYWQDDSLEDYSSQGPTNDGRLKPEISAPAGVWSAVYNEEFYGTSASTPHVAGAAALIWQAYPNFSVQDLKTYLQQQAIDLGPAGPDYAFGYGRLWLGNPPGSNTPPDMTPPALQPGPKPTPRPTFTPGYDVPPQAVGPASTSSVSTLLLLSLACLCCVAGLGLGGLLLLVILALATRPKPRRQMPYPPRGYVSQPPPSPGYPPQPAQPFAPPGAAAWPLCPRCRAPHHPEARFCPACGQPFAPPPAPPYQPQQQPPQAVACRYCGRPIHPASRVCPYCGKPR